MSKKALITGITGQDAAYLSKLLLEKGYEVFGGYRRTSNLNLWRLEELNIKNDVKIVPFDLLEMTNIIRIIEKLDPDEIYNLAAQSFVWISFEHPLLTSETNAMGPLRILEAIRTIDKDIKFYQASTSEMFGKAREIPQNENTPFYPRSPYGVSKSFAHWIAVNYRESYEMFTVSGILFNHESPLRGPEFVTRKISISTAKIKLGLQDKLLIGNLEAKRDWGYAPEYVEAMYLMMQQEKPEDYVIATGETHSVRDFITNAFSAVDIEIQWEKDKGIDKKTGKVLIETSEEFYRPAEVYHLQGDYSKAKENLGWYPETSFEELVRIMVEADLKRLKK